MFQNTWCVSKMFISYTSKETQESTALNGSNLTERAVPMQRKPTSLLKGPLLHYHAKISDQSGDLCFSRHNECWVQGSLRDWDAPSCLWKALPFSSVSDDACASQPLEVPHFPPFGEKMSKLSLEHKLSLLHPWSMNTFSAPLCWSWSRLTGMSYSRQGKDPAGVHMIQEGQ